MTALLVANNGGHVKQLHSLAPRLGLDEDRVWVTVASPQTKALLEGEEVLLVDYPDSRDTRALVRHAREASALFRRRRFSKVVSTGSSLALSVLPQAALRGLDTAFIESATRFEGPSMSGRLLAALPGVDVYTQYERRVTRRWRYGGSVFDGFEASETEPWDGSRPLRVVVTVGSTGAYGFRRLVERMIAVLPEDAEVLWQTGSTDVSGLPITARPSVPGDELDAAVRRADAVVAHAGTGTALGAVEAGKLPLIVPRRRAHGEHVDDHQSEIATALGNRGIALVREADALEMADVLQVARTVVARRDDPPPFRW
ncbi:glycosyltransferase [uncultured Pseudokineococcus sp.]|uniref:glycosyltransferase n=1 Tax=uncultured Pseudokineococcus sp. TaxID=1642928 RepID=UPI00262CAC25|nr:glycosyltransferase [uncultured Pseudokineococcus sp.]